VYQLKDGGLIGIAGDADHRAIVLLFDKVKGRKLPTAKQIINIGSDFESLLALKDGSLWYICCGKKDKNEEWYAQVIQLENQFSSIGSGAKYAIGAMDRGATAEQAVKTAIKYDPACGGKTQVYKLEIH